MIVSLLYKVIGKLLSAASVLFRGEATKDAELLVLQRRSIRTTQPNRLPRTA